MSGDHLRVFVSSRMEELAGERRLLGEVLEQLGMVPFIFEVSAGARPQTIQETYLEEIEAADLYLGIFWKGYGAYTIEEYEYAQSLGMDCLLYEKRESIEGERHPDLTAFLDKIGDVEQGLTVRWFYKTGELAEFVKEDVERWREMTVAEREGSEFAPLYVGVPPMPNSFVGRNRTLKQIANRLRAGGARALGIDGPPGVGKTTLIIGVAQHRGVLRRFTDGVLWGSLGPTPDVAGILRRWAEALEVDLSEATDNADIADKIQDAIGLRRMLIVIDDAWQIEAARLLRCGGRNCCYLLTSRDRVITREFAGASEAYSLAVLDDDSSVELLHELAPEVMSAEPELGEQLAEAVGGLPLALTLMGGSIASSEEALFPGFSNAALQDAGNLAEPAVRLKLAADRLGKRDGPITLEDTIALSLDVLPDHAVAAFHALGAFAAKPDQFSREAAEVVAETDARTLMLLAARHLVEIIETDVMVHQVLMDVARTRMEESATMRHREYYLSLVEKDQHDWKGIEAAYGQIKHAWGKIPDDWSVVRWLFSLYHYQAVRGHWRDRAEWSQRAIDLAVVNGWTDDEALLRYSLGQAVSRLGRVDEGLSHFKKGLALERQCGLSEIGSGTLTLVAQAYTRSGLHDDALENLQSALTLQEQEEDWNAVAITLGIMGNVLYRLQHRDEAADHFERSIEIVRSKVKDPTQGASVFVSAGNGFRRLGELEKALEYLEEGLRRHQENGSTKSVAHTFWEIGLVYERLGNFKQSLTYHKQAADGAAEVGDRSTHAAALLSCGEALAKLGNDSGAIEYFQKALELEEEIEAGPDPVLPLVAIGRALARQGKWDESLKHFENALATTGEEADQQYVVNGLSAVGDLAERSGRPEMQLRFRHKALEVVERLGDGLGTAIALRGVGIAHLGLGQFEPAREYVKRALAMAEHDDNRGGIAANTNELGRIAAEAGELEEALRLYQAALRINEADGRTGGIAANLNNMATVYMDLARADEAIEHYMKALSMAEAGATRRGVSATLSNIGNAYSDLGEAEKAQKYHRRALYINEELGDRLYAGQSWEAIGGDWMDQGEYAKALESYDKAEAIFEALGVAADIADVLNSKGLAHVLLGKGEKAVELYAKARQIYEELGNSAGVGLIENNLGGLHWEAGRLTEAQEHWLASIAISQRIGDRGQESGSRYNLAMLHRRQGRLRDALSELQKVAELDKDLIHPDLQRNRELLDKVREELAAGDAKERDT